MDARVKDRRYDGFAEPEASDADAETDRVHGAAGARPGGDPAGLTSPGRFDGRREPDRDRDRQDTEKGQTNRDGSPREQWTHYNLFPGRVRTGTSFLYEKP